MFGTDDVIYVPEGQPLVFDDVYGWKRYKIDVRHFGLRVRPGAFEEIATRVRSVLGIMRSSPRFAENFGQIDANANQMLRDLTAAAGHGHEALPGKLIDVVRADSASWWIRVSDLPAESFFDEDYEREIGAAGNSTPHFTYGNVKIAQLDGLDIALTGEGEAPTPEEKAAGMDTGSPLPFSIDVPEGGIQRFTMPPHEPLALVREFCGMHGNSAYGHTMNVTTMGDIAESHQFCTPLGRLGSKLYATIYFHATFPVAAKVMGKIPETRLFDYADLLEKSGFQLIKEGGAFRIYEREGGDVVHLYANLAGKETEGVETMPPVLLVAQAAGQFDPMQRGELFEAIVDTMGGQGA